MTKRLFALLLALVCLISVLPAVRATATVPCLTVNDRIVVIGDSNTVALQNYNPELNPARIYARVNGRIGETVADWTVYGDKYCAYGYNEGIYQLLCDLDGSDFDTVVINMGTNNIGGNLTDIHTCYARLLNNLYAKNPNAVIYTCLILPTNPNGTEPTYTPAAVKKINNVVTDVYNEYAEMGYDVRLLDLNTPFADSSGVLLSEYDNGGGVHLSRKGYKKLNELIQKTLAAGDPNAPHQWNEGEVVSVQSCTESGVRRYTCAACGAVREETAPALGHAWVVSEIDTTGDPVPYHELTARYVCTRCGSSKQAKLCAGEVFTDMPEEGNWAHDPIDWAWFNGITAGTSPTTFSPKRTVTRGEAMTFLWKTMGSPEPSTEENPFKDVKSGKYFYKPVLWAVESGVTDGTSPTTFSPGRKCTRAQIVTFLWAAAGRPEPTTEENPFYDVKADKYYYKAVLWAVENGITDGIAPNKFGPNKSCTRAQIVTFLYKCR